VFWCGKEEMPDPDLTMSNPSNLGFLLFNVMNPCSEIKDDYKTGIPFLNIERKILIFIEIKH